MMSLDDAIRRLEHCQSDFDVDQARTYASLVRQFYSNMKIYCTNNGLPLETPLFEVNRELQFDLPSEIKERLGRIIVGCSDYGTTVSNVCYWYLRDVYANQIGLVDRDVSPYEPLISILDRGGYFHEENGAMLLSVIAAIPFVYRD